MIGPMTQNLERSTNFSPHHWIRVEKRQNNEKNRWKRVENDENLSLIWKNKPNFRKARNGVSIYMKGDYDDFCGFGRRKNKPNSNPIKPNII